MKKLLILSGKGGTGKTTIASAFIKLLESKSYADCDVDAPNLHITVKPDLQGEHALFYGLPKAVIDSNKCTRCGLCEKNCRFGAISIGSEVKINPYACEGCRVCEHFCPAHAIEMKEIVSGETIVYHGETHFSTAKLKMGAGASGKLVSQVKKNMEDIKEDHAVAIIDGSPGVGCPVIASISGVDMVLIVTEPTVSGISDLKRILQTVRYFKSKCAVCINKYDINMTKTEEIKAYCKQENIPVVGMLPFDPAAPKAINERKSVVEIDCAVGQELRKVLSQTLNILEKK